MALIDLLAEPSWDTLWGRVDVHHVAGGDEACWRVDRLSSFLWILLSGVARRASMRHTKNE